TVPLEAETEFALPSGADVITPAPCGSALCGAQSSVATIGPSASNQWIVLVRPSISWRFIAAGQSPVQSAQYLPALSSLWVVRITLSFSRTAGWQVVPHTAQELGNIDLEQELARALCGAGVSELLMAAQRRGDLLSSHEERGVEGCALTLKTPTDGTN